MRDEPYIEDMMRDGISRYSDDDEVKICHFCDKPIEANQHYVEGENEYEYAHDACLKECEFWELLDWVGHSIRKEREKGWQ